MLPFHGDENLCDCQMKCEIERLDHLEDVGASNGKYPPTTCGIEIFENHQRKAILAVDNSSYHNFMAASNIGDTWQDINFDGYPYSRHRDVNYIYA